MFSASKVSQIALKSVAQIDNTCEICVRYQRDVRYLSFQELKLSNIYFSLYTWKSLKLNRIVSGANASKTKKSFLFIIEFELFGTFASINK